jgi:hypothetical protein
MNDFEEKIEKLIKVQDMLLNEIEKLRQQVTPFCEFVVEAKKVAENKDLSRGTIGANDNLEKYVEPTKKRLYVSIQSLPMLKHRRR